MDAAQTITHVLDRLSLGAKPGDRTQLEQAGIGTYLQRQLNAAGTPEPPALTDRLQALTVLDYPPVALFEQYAAPENPSMEELEQAKQRQLQVLQAAEQARLLRALASPHQLQEVMVDFWFNHFNVYGEHGLARIWTAHYEQTAIRPHALGSFRALLGATAKHPAMLFYLDNWLNIAPNSRAPRHRLGGINENYARELIELHTLGVNGGYSQADVENLARILTGWSCVYHNQPSPDDSGFVFAGVHHDPTDKVLLGETILGGADDEAGLAEGEAALDLLAHHPATARHISYKLAQHFVAEVPPDELVSQLTERFLQTDGDIRLVLATLFESAEFWNPAHYQRQFTTPYRYVMAIARALGMTLPSVTELTWLLGAIAQLGMPLYRCQTPNGYAQVGSAWLNPTAMLQRISLAIAAANLPADSPQSYPQSYPQTYPQILPCQMP
ncbi:MAG: DUF1800 domain-containing protein [Phormidesmis sp. RL_2_1]|nr:DUF1800 domain-containing protein [Phormidesmis sp. RL_2_1]